jgi:hypothetical protein
VGYRDEAIKLIRQANAMDVAKKDSAELRREVVNCLGDFLGSYPKLVNQPPAGVTVWAGEFSPTGEAMACSWSDGTIVLTDISSGREIGRGKAPL